MMLGVPIFKHFRVSCELIERIGSNMIEHSLWFQFQLYVLARLENSSIHSGSIHLLEPGVI